MDLLTALSLMGWAVPMPMGGWIPLPWAELKAFGDATGRLSDPWEYETVSAMSAAYVAGLADTGLLSIPPVERG